LTTLETYRLFGSLWTLWAVALFAGILWHAYRPSNRRRHEARGHIPLAD
jgi:cbb3-type cytochrome oxidase subunit 3